MIVRILLILAGFSVVFAQENFKPAASCGECHAENYHQWMRSMHAHASAGQDPLFRNMYEWAVADTDGKLKDKCIMCHSPMSTVFHSYDSSENFNREGVTCQFCHSVSAIQGHKSALDFDIDLTTVYSEKPAGENDAHPVAHRDYFTKSDFCLPCHAQMHNPNDVGVCTTGPEWRTYFEKSNMHCQDCHMRDADENLTHTFPGTHRGNMIRNAVDMQLDYDDAQRMITISLKNTGAGHALPTGTPLRMVVLKVVGYDQQGNMVWQNWEENPMIEDKSALFMKILGDAQGNGPVPPWKATQIVYEKRLMPDEVQTVQYVLENEDIYDVEVNLLYRFAPSLILEKFNLTETRFNRPRRIAQKNIVIAL